MNHLRELQHRKLLGELVVDTTFARSGRVQTGKLNTSHSVANVEETARLAALAVYSERVAGSRFDAESIERSAEDFVVIEAINKGFVELRFFRDGCHRLRLDSDRLRVISKAFAREENIVAVMHLREMIKGAGCFG